MKGIYSACFQVVDYSEFLLSNIDKNAALHLQSDWIYYIHKHTYLILVYIFFNVQVYEKNEQNQYIYR